MSKAANQEAVLKKRLQVFLADLSRVGTTKGFQHFSCYVRGKEELIISIKNTLPLSTTGQASVPSQPPSRKQSLKPTDSLNSSCLPYDKSSLTLSHNTQVGLSGLRDAGIGLPPASPSEQEPSQNEESTNFLIAGYSRYSCPYAWIRSNHDRLMKVVKNAGVEKDSPLRLKSTSRWHEGDVHVYEIIAELVKLCMYPSPRNPFELDLHYFRSLSQPHQCFVSAAMISFLDQVITHSQDSCPYSKKVFEEHQLLSKIHFSSLHDLMASGSLPILKQMEQQGSRSRQSSSSSSSSSSARQARRIHTPSAFSSSSSSSSSAAAAASASAFPSSHRYPTQAMSSMSTDAAAPTPMPPVVQSTVPVNSARAVRYGQGAPGAFPGGFDRMPAPSMF